MIPKKEQKERKALFSQLRQEYGFSEYALHAYATGATTTWIADHIDSNTAQKLATRAYQAASRVCLGQTKKVRFRRKGCGLESVEGKSNKQGLRFVLPSPEDPQLLYSLFLAWHGEALVRYRILNPVFQGHIGVTILFGATPTLSPEAACLRG